MRKILLSTILLLVAFVGVSAAESYDVNRNWKFFTYNESSAIMVNLPHQWNNDALSGRGDYYRGVGNYLRRIDILPEWKGKRLFLRFGGANAVTDLLIEGRHVGQHRGGSNGFTFEITPYVEYDKPNLFWIMINNSQMIDVLPTAGGDNAYGGIFRKLELIVTEPTTISPLYYGGDGVAITYTNINDQTAEGEVSVKLLTRKGLGTAVGKLSVMDAQGREVASSSAKAQNNNGETSVVIPFKIVSPHLWRGKSDPYLYRFDISIFVDDVLQDNTHIMSGVRSVSVDNEGFRLNGARYPVKGVVLHRDRSLVGSAMTDAQIEEDVDIIEQMGATVVRVAGGSHNSYFYDLCDSRGLLVFADMPLVGATALLNKGYYSTLDYRHNGMIQLNETISQLQNHPSVVAWNLFSELEIRGDNPVDYINEINTAAKELDPSRPTCGYSNQDGPINFITDMIVFGMTYGWVDGRIDDIELWSAQMHRPEWSKLRVAVGAKCGASVNHQADTLLKPVMPSNWHPENWQAAFHEAYSQTIGSDSLFWGEFVDCMFDFGSAGYTYGDGVGVCDLGLVSFDRQVRKDAFYLYKARWNSTDPFVYITERRRGERTNPVQNIKVYTNQPEVVLSVNGVPADTVSVVNGVALFEGVQLFTGRNVVQARAGSSRDSAPIEIRRGYVRPL